MRMINKSSSTKAERRIIEMLKRRHLKYKFRQKVLGYEADFVIDKYIIEVGDHKQNPEKNKKLIEGGYHVITFTNNVVKYRSDLIERHLIKIFNLCQKSQMSQRI